MSLIASWRFRRLMCGRLCLSDPLVLTLLISYREAQPGDMKKPINN